MKNKIILLCIVITLSTSLFANDDIKINSNYTVALYTNNPPFSFYENNKWDGTTVEFLNRIAELNKFSFTYVDYENTAENLVDIFADVNTIIFRKKDISFSKFYYKTNYSVVSTHRDNYNFFPYKKILLLSHSPANNYYKNIFENNKIQLEYFDNLEAIKHALLANKEYAFFNSITSFNYWTIFENNKFFIDASSDITVNLRFASYNARLLSILNSSIDRLKDDYIQNARRNPYKNRFSTMWVILISTTAILLFFQVVIISFIIINNIYKGNMNSIDKIRTKKITLENLSILVINYLLLSSNSNDKELDSHLNNVSIISEILAEQYGMDNIAVSEIKKFSALHDIGKLGVPNTILKKTDKLTNEEWIYMKKHVEIGAEIVTNFDFGITAYNIAKYHHERWDGKGYYNIKNKAIPIEARIVTIADVYDSLRETRSYKEAWSHNMAYEFLLENSELMFDPELIKIFTKREKDIIKLYPQI